MKVTFLGTGTSQGVPVIACDCPVCMSQDARDKRLRCSLLIETDTTTVVIDSGPDFRQQMLACGIKKLDALVYTHSHKDHLAGLDDVRAFNHFQQTATEIYATEFTQEVIKQEFSYIFQNSQYPGIPKVNLNTIDAQSTIQIGDINLVAIEVMHYKMPVLGFRFNNFTYITDANFISESEKEKVRDSKYLVLNALRRETHISHFTLDEAISLSQELDVDQTFLTHISHQMGRHEDVSKELPSGIKLAYDMLSIAI
ncbi:MAG: MBL fold metallo-hydrolase [Bacteroidetes bacterium]|nr:MBL fold metallo-hydrolase [Bacteroidota bacterium]MBK8145762.1 MBL fold metallo-hydrolase [Bacteroidota bacterium]